MNDTVEHDDSDLTGWNDRDEEVPSLLEVRYRAVLRLLPASYRADREEEMVDTYLECNAAAGDPDTLRPTLPEVLSIAALAVRVRLGGVGAAPRYFAWGQTVRLVALLGLLGHAAFNVIGVYYVLDLNGVLGPPPDLGVPYETAFGPPGSWIRIWFSLTTVLMLVWIPAFVLLVLGHRRAAKVFALFAAAPTIAGLARSIARVARDAGPWEGVWISLSQGLLVLLPVLALLAGFHRDAPAVRDAGRWLAGMGALAAATLGAVLLAGNSLYFVGWLDGVGPLCLLLIGAGLLQAGVHLFMPSRRDPVWPTALMILALPVLAARLSTVHYLTGLSSADADGAVIVYLETAMLAAVSLVLPVLAYLSLRRIPRSTLPSVDR